MGLYDKEVAEIIGNIPLSLIKQSVIKHDLNAQQTKDIAYLLHDHVGGNHARRMEENGGKCDEPEFRYILSDWYSVGKMCDMEQTLVLGELIRIFRHDTVNLLPLANQLEKCQKTMRSDDLKTGDKLKVEQGQSSPAVCPAIGRMTVNDSGTSIAFSFKPRSWPKGFENSVNVPLREPDLSIQVWRETCCDCVGIGHSVYKVKSTDFAAPIVLDIHLGAKIISTNTKSVELEEMQTSQLIPADKLKDCVNNESAFCYLLDNLSTLECKKGLDAKELMYTIAQNGAVSCLEYLDKTKKIEVLLHKILFYIFQSHSNTTIV